jgi:hypothetical protein
MSGRSYSKASWPQVLWHPWESGGGQSQRNELMSFSCCRGLSVVRQCAIDLKPPMTKPDSRSASWRIPALWVGISENTRLSTVRFPLSSGKNGPFLRGFPLQVVNFLCLADWLAERVGFDAMLFERWYRLLAFASLHYPKSLIVFDLNRRKHFFRNGLFRRPSHQIREKR